MWLPRMRFLFVGPGVCLQLPSDSASRRTPLLFGWRFPSPGSAGDFHPQVTGGPPRPPDIARHGAARHAWRTKKKRRRELPRGAFPCPRVLVPLDFPDVGRFLSFGSGGHLELHFHPLGEGAEAVSRNLAEM